MFGREVIGARYGLSLIGAKADFSVLASYPEFSPNSSRVATAKKIAKLIAHCQKEHTQLIFNDVQFQVLRTLAKADIQAIDGVFRLYPRLGDAVRG